MYMLAFMKISIQEGIAKKVVAQAKALSGVYRICDLLCIDEKGFFQVICFEDGRILHSNSFNTMIDVENKSLLRVNEFIAFAEKLMSPTSDIVYIRHMIPSRKYVSFLSKHKSCKIVYEIPTYPYYYEQFKASNKKIFTLFRLAYETIYWPLIYKNIDRLICISCKSTAKKFKKMVNITNGFTDDEESLIEGKIKKGNEITTLIGVGHIYRYHGYDKIIRMIAKSNNRKRIQFIVVGNGNIEYLKTIAYEQNVEECVLFVGEKNGYDLQKLYSQADIGVGTMSLELRKADIDTGIKVIDYYSHGLPVISSGICPTVKGMKKQCYFRIRDNTSMDEIVEWGKTIDSETRYELRKRAIEQFSWQKIFEHALA